MRTEEEYEMLFEAAKLLKDDVQKLPVNEKDKQALLEMLDNMLFNEVFSDLCDNTLEWMEKGNDAFDELVKELNETKENVFHNNQHVFQEEGCRQNGCGE